MPYSYKVHFIADLYVSSPAQVEGVSVEALNDTAVEVTWKSAALPLEELTGYRVDYRETVKGQKREAKCTCEEFEMFPKDVSSGVIGGLETGVSYQFQVTALARTVDGSEVEGEASQVDNSTIATPGQQGTEALQIGTQESHSYMHTHTCCSGTLSVCLMSLLKWVVAVAQRCVSIGTIT